MSDYWEMQMSEACEEAGIEATKEQIDTLASWAESAHDFYGQAHGYDVGRPSMILESDHVTTVRNLEKQADADLAARDKRERDLRWDNDRLRDRIRVLREDLQRATQ